MKSPWNQHLPLGNHEKSPELPISAAQARGREAARELHAGCRVELSDLSTRLRVGGPAMWISLARWWMMVIDGYSLDDFYQVDDLTSKIYNHIIYITTIWLYLPLWKMMEFVSWDDDIPNIWKIKNVPNHQPVVNDGYWRLLSGNLTVCYWKWHVYDGFTWIYPLKMVIFHSYVSLPEGNDG